MPPIEYTFDTAVAQNVSYRAKLQWGFEVIQGDGQNELTHRFSDAELLVDGKLIKDYPTAISPLSLTLAAHGPVSLYKVQWIRVRNHPDRKVSGKGVDILTPRMIKQSRKPLGLKEQKREAKRQAAKARRFQHRVATKPKPVVNHRLLWQQQQILDRVMKEVAEEQKK
jgi:hypothetical protein